MYLNSKLILKSTFQNHFQPMLYVIDYCVPPATQAGDQCVNNLLIFNQQIGSYSDRYYLLIPSICISFFPKNYHLLLKFYTKLPAPLHNIFSLTPPPHPPPNPSLNMCTSVYFQAVATYISLGDQCLTLINMAMAIYGSHIFKPIQLMKL